MRRRSTATRFVNCSDAIGQFAEMIREHERQQRFDLEGQDRGDMLRITIAARSYAAKHALVEFPQCKLPSELLYRFADVVGDDVYDDRMRKSDLGYQDLLKIVQAMAAYARQYCNFNLFKGRPIHLIPGNDGRLIPEI